MNALDALLAELRASGHGEVPGFDPLDGGADARVLLVLQRPGPGAVRSGFVSRDNHDLTARYLREALAAAGLARKGTLLWNVVPWFAPVAAAMPRAEVALGAAWLQRLIGALPRLVSLVLVGRVAQSADVLLRPPPGVTRHAMPHPSPNNIHARPEARGEVATVLAEVAARLRQQPAVRLSAPPCRAPRSSRVRALRET